MQTEYNASPEFWVALENLKKMFDNIDLSKYQNSSGGIIVV